jgi:hypothetical protein
VAAGVGGDIGFLSRGGRPVKRPCTTRRWALREGRRMIAALQDARASFDTARTLDVVFSETVFERSRRAGTASPYLEALNGH